MSFVVCIVPDSVDGGQPRRRDPTLRLEVGVRAVVCRVAEMVGVDAPTASMLVSALSAREVASGSRVVSSAELLLSSV